jgi:hypothetical protein
MAMDKGADNPSGVLLKVSAAQELNTLLIDYQVSNQRDTRIYLLNRIFQWTEKGLEIKAGFIYTEVIGGELRLTKAYLPVPDNVLVEMPDVPYLTAVESGAVFSEQVRLSTPLEPFHPYDQVDYSEDIHTYEGASLVIGWLAEGDFELRRGTTPITGESILAVEHSQAARAQHLLKAAIDLPIPVLFTPVD